MADTTARVERIRTQAREAKAAAKQLVDRVSDQKFNQAVNTIVGRIAEHEAFFLDRIADVNVINVGVWLDSAELLLGAEYNSLQYYQEAARSRGYRIQLL